MQVTTRIEGNGTSKMVPALGEVWGHACTNRIFLHHKQVLLNHEYITKETAQMNHSLRSSSSHLLFPFLTIIFIYTC